MELELNSVFGECRDGLQFRTTTDASKDSEITNLVSST